MMTAKINKTGKSQTVKLPEEYKFSEDFMQDVRAHSFLRKEKIYRSDKRKN